MADKKTTSGKVTDSKVWTDEEISAMRDRAKELKAAQGRKGKSDGEADVQAKFAEMSPTDRAIGEGIHAIVKRVAPHLAPRTWYGMPAYARDSGKLVCFFQPAAKFKVRYATLGFDDGSNLDEGTMWPMAYAITAMTPENEAQIAALVEKAAS